jgi:hypothetical protein
MCPPRFASMITPPPSAIAERTALGGLLMSATEETFRVDNPAHLAVARDILKALAPFEALPGRPTPRQNEKHLIAAAQLRDLAAAVAAILDIGEQPLRAVQAGVLGQQANGAIGLLALPRTVRTTTPSSH